jgi:hypothetical protein
MTRYLGFMRRRLPIGLGGFALAAVPLLAAWVPPYGGGADQLFEPKPGLSRSEPGAPPPHDRLETLFRASWVCGTALDASGDPIPNAVVTAESLSNPGGWGTRWAECDEHGNYQIPLEVGTWFMGFAGGPARLDEGTTRVITLETTGQPRVHLDFRLKGSAALLAEVQIQELAGLEIECELLDAEGNPVASGHAIGGASWIERRLVGLDIAVQRLQGNASYDPEVPLGRGLCFEGLPAGDYRLRVHLNREQGLFHERRVRLEIDAVTDLGRLNLGVEDFGSDLELTSRYLDRSKHIDPRYIYWQF